MKHARKIGAASAVGILLIAVSEGFSDSAHQPLPGDKWTIGFGHTGGVEPGTTISVQEALGLLHNDTYAAEQAVSRLTRWDLEQHQFDALVSLVYNIGARAFETSTLLKCVNAYDEAGVEREWMRWVYFKGKRVQGLENRRARELAVWRGEKVFESGGTVCFGGGLCLPYDVLVQERSGGPDGADTGGAA